MTSSIGHGPPFDRWAKVLGVPGLHGVDSEVERLDGPSARGLRALDPSAPPVPDGGSPRRSPPRGGPSALALWCFAMAALVAVVGIEWSVCGWLGAVYVRPHPYWLPVLVAAVGLGVRGGLVLGFSAAALWVTAAFRIGEFATVSALWTSWRGLEPLGFVVLGYALGEWSDRARRRAIRLDNERQAAIRDADRWREAAEAARLERQVAVRQLQFESMGFAEAIDLATRIQQRCAVSGGDAEVASDASQAHQRIARVALGLLAEQCAVSRAVVLGAPAEATPPVVLATLGGEWSAEAARARWVDPRIQPALDTGAFVDYLRDPREGENAGVPLWVAPLRSADGVVVGVLCVEAFDAATLTPESVMDARAIVAWCEAAFSAAEAPPAAAVDTEAEPVSAHVGSADASADVDENADAAEAIVEEVTAELDDLDASSALMMTPDDVRGWFAMRSPRADEDWTLSPLERPLPGLEVFQERLAIETVRAVEHHLPPAVLGVELPLDVSRHDPLVADTVARDAVIADVALEVLGRGLRSTDGLFIGPSRRYLRVLLPGTKSAGAWVVCERLLRLARTVSPMLAGCSVRVLDAAAEFEVPDPSAPVAESALALPGGSELAGRLGREWHLARRHRRDLHVVHAVTDTAVDHLGPVYVAVRAALHRPLEELFVPAAGRLTVLLPGADGLRAFAIHDVVERVLREQVGEDAQIEVFSLGADGPEYQPFLARVLR